MGTQVQLRIIDSAFNFNGCSIFRCQTVRSKCIVQHIPTHILYLFSKLSEPHILLAYYHRNPYNFSLFISPRSLSISPSFLLSRALWFQLISALFMANDHLKVKHLFVRTHSTKSTHSNDFASMWKSTEAVVDVSKWTICCKMKRKCHIRAYNWHKNIYEDEINTTLKLDAATKMYALRHTFGILFKHNIVNSMRKKCHIARGSKKQQSKNAHALAPSLSPPIGSHHHHRHRNRRQHHSAHTKCFKRKKKNIVWNAGTPIASLTRGTVRVYVYVSMRAPCVRVLACVCVSVRNAWNNFL